MFWTVFWGCIAAYFVACAALFLITVIVGKVSMLREVRDLREIAHMVVEEINKEETEDEES